MGLHGQVSHWRYREKSTQKDYRGVTKRGIARNFYPALLPTLTRTMTPHWTPIQGFTRPTVICPNGAIKCNAGPPKTLCSRSCTEELSPTQIQYEPLNSSVTSTIFQPMPNFVSSV